MTPEENPMSGPLDISPVNAVLTAVLLLSSSVILGVVEVSIPGVDVAAVAPWALTLALLGLTLKAMVVETPTTDDSSDSRYPVPEFDRPGVPYWCTKCDDWVEPSEDDIPEAGLLIGGYTGKLCPGCAREIRDDIERDMEGSQ